MFRCLGSLVLWGFLVSGTSPLCPRAAADDGAAVVINNPSHVAIPYQVRVGHGEWKRQVISYGYSRTHRWTDYSHGLSIRFDWIAGDGQVTFKYYDLRPGGRYVFRYSHDGRYLDLYRE